VADARPVDGYGHVLASAGLETVLVEHHDEALGYMIDVRITTLAMAGTTALTGIDPAVGSAPHHRSATGGQQWSRRLRVDSRLPTVIAVPRPALPARERSAQTVRSA